MGAPGRSFLWMPANNPCCQGNENGAGCDAGCPGPRMNNRDRWDDYHAAIEAIPCPSCGGYACPLGDYCGQDEG